MKQGDNMQLDRVQCLRKNELGVTAKIYGFSFYNQFLEPYQKGRDFRVLNGRAQRKCGAFCPGQ